MKWDNLEQLLQKYYDGETSVEDAFTAGLLKAARGPV
jgi:hypothetical protein